MEDGLAERYERVIRNIAQLARYERYEGAFVIGSYATGRLHPGSDIDIIVLIAGESDGCLHVNHPSVDGIGLDISFNTYGEITGQVDAALQKYPRKLPWISNAIILFDKGGRLQQLKDRTLREAAPTLRPPGDVEAIQAEMYYCYTKPGEILNVDPESADLMMHLQLGDILRLHYTLNGRWWSGYKHMLEDLKQWDEPLYWLLIGFLKAVSIPEKYGWWQTMIAHVLAAVGGMDFHRLDGDCDCQSCREDLARLMALFP